MAAVEERWVAKAELFCHQQVCMPSCLPSW